VTADASQRKLAKAIADLLEVCASADRLVARGRKVFDRDEVSRLASEAIISRLGEAVRRLPESFRDQHPSQRWSAMLGTRNLVAHEYARIDHEIIWNALRVEVPKLRKFLESLPRATVTLSKHR
jgi:uncharacterized protein with HEPN domain